MGFGSRAFLAGGLGFAAAFVVACGGSNGLLSGDQSSTLSSQLDAVSAAVKTGNCAAATSAADAFDNSVGNLPSSVSNTLVQNLGDAAVTVKRLATRDCSSSSSTTSTSTTTTTTTSTQAPTTTETHTTTQTATPTSSTQPSTGTATNPSPPGTTSAPSGGAGLGNGNGNGNGGSGNGNSGNGNGNGNGAAAQ